MLSKLKNDSLNKQNIVLLDNSCMCSNLYWSKTEEERKDLFKEFLPNSLEYDIVDINNKQKCECCTDMKKFDLNCKTEKQIGYNAYYVQSKYLGNKKLCCLRNSDQENELEEKVNFDRDGNYIKNLTCDPKFKPWLLDCKNSLNSFCSINGNIFKKKECKNHCQRYPRDCINIKKNICNNLDNYKKNKIFCDEFCLLHEGECDQSMIAYCNEKPNLNDSICACINANLKNPHIYNINPKCFDLDCMVHGYTTKVLKNTTKQTSCPQTSCQIIVNSKDADIILKNNYLKNYCGNTNPEITSLNQQNSWFSKKNSNSIIICLFFLIFINILLIYFF